MVWKDPYLSKGCMFLSALLRKRQSKLYKAQDANLSKPLAVNVMVQKRTSDLIPYLAKADFVNVIK